MKKFLGLLFSTIIQDDIVNAVTGFAKKVTTGSANDLDEPKYRRVQIFNQDQENQVITPLLMQISKSYLKLTIFSSKNENMKETNTGHVTRE